MYFVLSLRAGCREEKACLQQCSVKSSLAGLQAGTAVWLQRLSLGNCSRLSAVCTYELGRKIHQKTKLHRLGDWIYRPSSAATEPDWRFLSGCAVCSVESVAVRGKVRLAETAAPDCSRGDLQTTPASAATNTDCSRAVLHATAPVHKQHTFYK